MLCAVGISLLSIFASTSSSPVNLAVSGGLPGINLNKYDSKFSMISFVYIFIRKKSPAKVMVEIGFLP